MTNSWLDRILLCLVNYGWGIIRRLEEVVAQDVDVEYPNPWFVAQSLYPTNKKIIQNTFIQFQMTHFSDVITGTNPHQHILL